MNPAGLRRFALFVVRDVLIFVSAEVVFELIHLLVAFVPVTSAPATAMERLHQLSMRGTALVVFAIFLVDGLREYLGETRFSRLRSGFAWVGRRLAALAPGVARGGRAFAFWFAWALFP